MNKPSRRTVVRTGVWTVPVVAAATAAPALATSTTPPPVTIKATATGCKLPGQSTSTSFGYNIVLTLINCNANALEVLVTDFVFTPNTKTVTSFSKGPFTAYGTASCTAANHCTIDGNGCAETEVLVTVTSTASAQNGAIVTYMVSGQTYTAPISFGTFDPCNCNKNPGSIADCAPNAS